MPSLLERLQFPEASAEFVSQYSLPETIIRLADATSPSNLFSFKRRLHGGFDGTKVTLKCLFPLEGNPYAPIFTGSFREEARGVVLSGRFAVKQWVIIQRNIGLVAATLAAAGFTLAALTQFRTMWPVPFVTVSVLALFYGQDCLLCKRAHNDVKWLTHQIGRTIGSFADWPEPPPPPAGWLQRRFAALSGQ